jgi:hypothetical protein
MIVPRGQVHRAPARCAYIFFFLAPFAGHEQPRHVLERLLKIRQRDALARVGLQRSDEDRPEFVGDVVVVLNGLALAEELDVARVCDRVRHVPGQLASHHLEQDDAKGPDVRREGVVLAREEISSEALCGQC